MESTKSWPPSEDMFSMAPNDDITNGLFDPSPTDSCGPWDPSNNDWKSDGEWRLFGGDIPTIDSMPQQPPLGGLPSRAGPSSSLSSSNSSTAIFPNSNHQLPSTVPTETATMLPFRPTEPMNVPAWGLHQAQQLPEQPFSGLSANGLLIQMSASAQPQAPYGTGVDQIVFNEPTQSGPGIPWNDNTLGFNNALGHPYTPTVPKLECSSPTDADDEAGDAGDQSYAKLLYECLLHAPGHTLPLKDIYGWMQQNTSKARDPSSKGWQNSVRHNLSMNHGFQKVPGSAGHGAKKGGAGLWRLSDEALSKGAIISTTRYRKEPKKRHGRRVGAMPAPKRVASGAKGGRATRDGRDRQQRLQARGYHATSTPGMHPPRSTPFFGRMPTPGQYSSTSAASSPMFGQMASSDATFGGLFPQDSIQHGLPTMPLPQHTPSPMPGPIPSHHSSRPAHGPGQYMPTPDPSSDYFTDCDTSPWATTTSVTPDPAEVQLFNGMAGGFFQSPGYGREQSMQA